MIQWEISERPRIRSPARLKYDEARQTDILLLPERVILLNAAAGAILRLCDGNYTIENIIQKLEDDYQQSSLKEDIVGFLQKALEKGWVETCK